MYILMGVCVSTAFCDERQSFKSISNNHFSVSIPQSWSVELLSEGDNSWSYTFLDGTNCVFQAAVWQATSFLDCFCAPWNKYTTIKRKNEEVRTIRLSDECRTVKIAGKKFSIDIHTNHKGYDKQLMDEVLDSIRMNNNGANHGLESTSAPPAAGTLETHP